MRKGILKMKRKTRLAGGIGAAAIALVGAWEGLRLTAYRDVVGIPTVCYGETKGVKLGDQHTKAECDSMLMSSLQAHEYGMRKCLKDPDGIPDRSYVAFVSLTYNIGTGAFCRSTARKRLDAGDLRGACDAATWFKKAGGRTIPGLVNRRKAEHELCLEGLSSPAGLGAVAETPRTKPVPAPAPDAPSPEVASGAVPAWVAGGVFFVLFLAGAFFVVRQSRKGG
jgi:lysozyme